MLARVLLKKKIGQITRRKIRDNKKKKIRVKRVCDKLIKSTRMYVNIYINTHIMHVYICFIESIVDVNYK